MNETRRNNAGRHARVRGCYQIAVMTLAAIGLLLTCHPHLRGQQGGSPVTVVTYPHDSPSVFMSYDASSNLEYACYANPLGRTSPSPDTNYTYSLSVTGGTLTSIVVLTNVGTVTTVSAHGLQPGQQTAVSGSTTSALNSTYRIATVPTSTTFTIATSGVANATYNNGPLTIAGTVPLLTSAIWSIAHFNYDSSNRLVGTQWANGTPGNYSQICANRATITSYK